MITTVTATKVLLTEHEVASMLKISLSTLRANRFKQRGIPYLKIGRAVRYAYDDVVAYMQAKKITFAA